MHNIRGGASRWQTHDFLFDGNSNVCSISHHLQDIRKTNKMQSLTLKIKVKVMEEKNGCFFQDWIYSATLRNPYAKGYTHTHTHTITHSARDIGDDYRQNLQNGFT